MPEDERQLRLSRELFLAAFRPPGSGETEAWLLERLMTAFEEVTVEAGEPLFERGEPPYYLYFIRDGSFRLEREGAASIVYNGRWVLGSFDVFADRPRPRTAVALKTTEVWRLHLEDWTELLEESFTLARNVLVNAGRIISGLYEKLAPEGGFPAPRPADALELPPGKLDLIERSLVLSEVPLLRGAGVQALTDLAVTAEQLDLAAGESLIEAGARHDRLFVVADGAFEGRRERPFVSGKFGPGSLVFGAAALGELGQAWSARALAPSRVLAVSLEQWLDELEEHFEGLRAALAVFAHERERLLDALAEQEGGLVLT